MSGRGSTLPGSLKQAIRDVNEPPKRKGADVDAVIEAVANRTEYTEADAQDGLNQMLLEGEVYPPGDGRVKETPL